MEPRLSVETEWRRWPVEGDGVPPVNVECPEPKLELADLLLKFHQRSNCVSRIIPLLEIEARDNATALSDLAAAYYVSAQQKQQPIDYLRALTAAEEAVRALPHSPQARFNLALAQEASGLLDYAKESWKTVATMTHDDWSVEASRHYRDLPGGAVAAKQWPLNKQQLAVALRARDAVLAANLIAAYPSYADDHFAFDLLPRWATQPTVENFEQVKFFARILSQRLGNDPFPLDTIAAIERATPAQRELLRRGHRQFGNGHYSEASQNLASGGSLFHLRADWKLASESSLANNAETIEAVEKAATSRKYKHFLIRVYWTHAHILETTIPLSAVPLYLAAIDQAEELKDTNMVASVRARYADLRRTMGLSEPALEQALEAAHNANEVIRLQDHHAIWNTLKEIAIDLGEPRAAFQYLNAGIDAYRSIDPNADSSPHYALLLRERARLRIRFAAFELAEEDLKRSDAIIKAAALTVDEQREATRKSEEVRGQLQLARRLPDAVRHFTNALLNCDPAHHTFKANLLVQRAQAHLVTDETELAEVDLRSALDEWRNEESTTLKDREVGENEDLWSAYFSRSREAFRLLADILIKQGRNEEAFVASERARAFEVLDLILDKERIPPAFQELVEGGLSLSEFRKRIPEDTVILQYAVFPQRTAVWLIGRSHFLLLPDLPAGAETIERWAISLQERRGNDRAALEAAFDALVRAPLAEIERWSGGLAHRRLVIVPDGPLHGLPFAAFHDSDHERYLIETGPIAMAGSTRLYLYSLARDRELPCTGALSILSVGNPKPALHPVTQQNLDDLFYAEREAKAVLAVYGSNSRPLTREEATPEAFFQNARGKDLLLFAGHALADHDVPSRSSLILAGKNGAVDAKQILTNLHLDRTRLAVLSACSSGNSRFVGPEGVGPLVRPFIASQVPGVVATLWDVKDATVGSFVVSFHRHYRGNEDAATALRSAQLEQLKDKKNTSMDWAAYQVIGYASSPFACQPGNGGTNNDRVSASHLLHRADGLRTQ